MLRSFDMTTEGYLKERLDDQIEWYDQKSKNNQYWFKGLRTAEIIIAALIPFISGITASYGGFEKTGLILLGLAGVIIAIIAGVLSLGQFQEHWIEYRTTCESLKKEKFLFKTGAEPYGHDESFNLLVQRVETLVSQENTNWAQYMMKREKADKK